MTDLDRVRNRILRGSARRATGGLPTRKETLRDLEARRRLIARTTRIARLFA